MNAESGACADKKRIATRAKALNLDALSRCHTERYH